MNKTSLIGALAVAGSVIASAGAAQTAPAANTVTPAIAGVVAAGTPVEQIQAWDPCFGGEGPVPFGDRGILVCLQDQNKIVAIDKNRMLTTYAENTPRTNGLGFDSKGRLIGVGSTPPQIVTFAPSRGVLVDAFEGHPFLQTSDLVFGVKDDIYFADPTPRALRRAGDAGALEAMKAAVYHLTPDGRLTKISEDVPRPNGIQLSPDEKTLYVADTDYVIAFDIQADGTLRNRRNFAKVGADGLAVDAAGRLFAAGVGIRVFAPDGQDLGTIPIAIKPANLTFGGAADRNSLYVVGRGGAYKIVTLTEGPKGRAK
ncbi:MAG: gnl [Acidobacteria bacterium]|nr:gnl [Acidobacteriota bacterium]